MNEGIINKKGILDMAKRVTIVFDDEILIKLRKLQAQKIRQTSKAVSFSAIVNDTLRK